jgi:hypothetical protein
MLYVSLIVEALRVRPRAVFWGVALAQAAVWFVVPALFYTSPPGDLAAVLAVGREAVAGSWLGPPLAPWLAALFFKLSGGHIAAVYLLAQICVVAAYWAMFAFGRMIAGSRLAVLAVMLMTGVLALTVPTPEFGPSVLALPFTAFALLYFWRALGGRERIAWIGFALALGLLLLASYWGVLLAVLSAYFMALVPEGRAAARRFEPWAAFAAALVIALPHWLWLWRSGTFGRLIAPFPPDALPGMLARWPLLLAAVIAAHVGLAVLVAAAAGWGADRRLEVPEIEGEPAPPLARRFVLFFTFALPIVGTLAAALLGRHLTLPLTGPLVLTSGLAVIAAARRPLALRHQDLLGPLWSAVLLVPPIIAILGLLLAPWTGYFDPPSRQPAAAMAHFFTDIYHRRTGQSLAIIGGEGRLPFLIAAAASDHPRVYSADVPDWTPWLTDQDVRQSGGIIVWPLGDAAGQPPATIRARFPDLVAEVPQTFERPIEGLLPPLRLGWSLIRPRQPFSGADRPAGSK